MNWVKKHKLLAIKAFQYMGYPYIKLNDLWQALHQTFNLAQNQQVNIWLLNEIPLKSIRKWPKFSKEKFKNEIHKYNSSFTPGSNWISWRYLKVIVNNDKCLFNIINIANMCINLGHWPLYFKMSTSILIPKPNKALYDSLEIFRPIILLNMLDKIIEKVIDGKL